MMRTHDDSYDTVIVRPDHHRYRCCPNIGVTHDHPHAEHDRDVDYVVVIVINKSVTFMKRA